MPIRPPALLRNLLRASASAPAIGSLQALLSRPAAENWLLLVDLGPGQYAVLNASDLSDAAIASLTQNPATTLASLAYPAPTADADLDDPQSARDSYDKLAAQGSPLSRYMVVLRDGEPIGALLVRRPRSNLNDHASFVRGLATKSVTPGATPRPLPSRTDRYVNTDFATTEAPDVAISRDTALAAGAQVLFRVHVGALEQSTIEETATQIQAELLTEEIELTVVLFSEDVQLDATLGTIFVPLDGATQVRQRASAPAGAAAALLDERLLFQITLPERDGPVSLRCSIYCHGLLIQSRLITAVVGGGQALDAQGRLRRSVLDFNLSGSLLPGLLSAIEPHRLSLMVNSMPDGTHAFRLLAQEGQELFTNSASLSGGELTNLIDLTRKRLRQVAWGKDTEWNNDPYRYDPAIERDELLARLRQDIIRMAIRGALLYNAASKDLAGGAQGARELRKLMRTPGMIQLASKISASEIVPIAMFYDYRIDTQDEGLTLCPAFEASLASGRPLIDEPCFKGECPSASDPDNLTVVCPSGFWGFRHDIGMPYPVRARGPELATSISYTGQPVMEAGYFADFGMVQGHLKQISALGYQLTSIGSRKELFKALREQKPQMVYFYCHGVESDTIPYLWIGKQSETEYIATDNFANYEIDWPEQRPLVFINGCHTTALTPEKALSFVKTFVEDTSASGVIGTEITIFEPLATAFAESFMQLFAAGVPLGRAIRAARLDLLGKANPLGLVYMPHAYAGLRMVKG
jgi:hypothetical protein